MDIRKLQRAIVDGLEDVKAQNIVVFNTEALSPLFERVIIASGTSNRQTKALASSVRDSVKKRGMDVLRTEGEDNGEWIIVDCGAAVAHIMQPAIRDYYHLEEIWGGKPVNMKLGDAKVSLPKASEDGSARGGGRAAKPVAQGAGKTTAKAAARPAPGSPAKAGSKAGSKVATKTASKPARTPARQPKPAGAPATKAPARKAAAATGATKAAPAARKAAAPAKKAAPARKAAARRA